MVSVFLRSESHVFLRSEVCFCEVNVFLRSEVCFCEVRCVFDGYINLKVAKNAISFSNSSLTGLSELLCSVFFLPFLTT